MKAKILWIEGKRAESPPFIPALRRKGFTVETVSTGNEAVSRLKELSQVEAQRTQRQEAATGNDDLDHLGLSPDLVVVNVASLRSTGKRICRAFANSRMVCRSW